MIEQELAQATARITELTTANDAANASLVTARAELTTAQGELATAKTDLATVSAERDARAAELATANNALAALKTEKEAAEAALATAKAEHATALAVAQRDAAAFDERVANAAAEIASRSGSKPAGIAPGAAAEDDTEHAGKTSAELYAAMAKLPTQDQRAFYLKHIKGKAQ